MGKNHDETMVFAGLLTAGLIAAGVSVARKVFGGKKQIEPLRPTPDVVRVRTDEYYRRKK